MRSAAERQLLEFFRNYRELQLGLGQGLDDHPLGAFGGGVLGGSHFADEQVLGALQHFLFTEGEGLVAAEGNQALRTAATSISDPVRMRSEFSLKRCFQSGCEFSLPFSRKPRTSVDSFERITDRSPTVPALDCGTITRNPLETIRIM